MRVPEFADLSFSLPTTFLKSQTFKEAQEIAARQEAEAKARAEQAAIDKAAKVETHKAIETRPSVGVNRLLDFPPGILADRNVFYEDWIRLDPKIAKMLAQSRQSRMALALMSTAPAPSGQRALPAKMANDTKQKYLYRWPDLVEKLKQVYITGLNPFEIHTLDLIDQAVAHLGKPRHPDYVRLQRMDTGQRPLYGAPKPPRYAPTRRTSWTIQQALELPPNHFFYPPRKILEAPEHGNFRLERGEKKPFPVLLHVEHPIRMLYPPHAAIAFAEGKKTRDLIAFWHNVRTFNNVAYHYPWPNPANMWWYAFQRHAKEGLQKWLEAESAAGNIIPEEKMQDFLTAILLDNLHLIVKDVQQQAKEKEKRAKRKGVFKMIFFAAFGAMTLAIPGVASAIFSLLQTVGETMQKIQVAKKMEKVALAFEARDKMFAEEIRRLEDKFGVDVSAEEVAAGMTPEEKNVASMPVVEDERTVLLAAQEEPETPVWPILVGVGTGVAILAGLYFLVVKK